MTPFRTLAAAAALSLAAAAAPAASLSIQADAGDFFFDGSLSELFVTELTPTGGDLAGPFDFIYVVDGSFSEFFIDGFFSSLATLTGDDGDSLTFSIPGVGDLYGLGEEDDVVLTISGFNSASPIIPQFQAAPSDFFGPATDAVAPIPLPAAAWLLAFGVGALAALGRARRSA
jgi:hypothetical protein